MTGIRRGAAVLAPLVTVVLLAPATAHAAAARPGARGVGDGYFPLAGNGGYDVRHYALDIRYEPATRAFTGTATITARATGSLSSFNLDLRGFTVRSVRVGDRP